MKVAIRVTPVGKEKHLPLFPYQNSPNVPAHIIVQLLEIRCPQWTITGSVILIMYLSHTQMMVLGGIFSSEVMVETADSPFAELLLLVYTGYLMFLVLFSFSCL